MSGEKTIAEIAATLGLAESLIREWVWNASPVDAADSTRAEAETETQADAVARAEAIAAEATAAAARAQAQLEAVRAELEAARAEIAVRVAAEAALREEIKTVYAEAVEAINHAEAMAAESAARTEAVTAGSEVTKAGMEPAPPDRSNSEAEARAKIAEVMARVRGEKHARP